MASRRSTSRVTLSVRVERVLAERVRTCVRDGAGKPLYLTMGSFVADALEAHLVAAALKLESPERETRRITNSQR